MAASPVLSGGPDAPGMNAVLRTVLRTAMNDGQDVVGVRYGFARAGAQRYLGPAVDGRAAVGGAWAAASWAPSATSLTAEEITGVAETIRKWDIRGLIAIGGLDTYRQVARLVDNRDRTPSSRSR